MISTSAIIILLAVLIFCLLLGVPIGFALGLSGIITIWTSVGTDFMIQIPITLHSSLSDFVFVAIPLYVLMGEILYHGKSGERIFMVAHRLLRKIKGGTGVAGVSAFSFFSAIVGSSMTSVVTIGKIAIPEMIKQNYSKKLSFGLSAVGGSLGILIPPSIPLILYASLSGSSPGKLFIAGIIPGVLLAALLSVYAIIMAPKTKENFIDKDGSTDLNDNYETSATLVEKRGSILVALPDLILPIIVLGGIYAGIYTPTEAAGVGVIYSLIVCLLIHRSLKVKLLPKVLVNSAKTSTMLLTVVVGALVFGSSLTLIGLPQYLSGFITDLSVSPWVILLLMNIIWLTMGFFLEVVSILLITTPIFYPIAMSLGFDPIWFGIIMVINMELAVITPPIGMNLFALKSLFPNESMKLIIKSVLPFVLMVVMVLVIVWFFPQVALVLVN
ncbi:TRAP transporter large permease [Lentibacillus jeotgali]|uniref:TRAP transporter large permease n=1 Tax=Lentibacillus jeotgali TaxID=558169 RepID=UPI00026287CF|nr:TRAP transporter large permease subunit [Lentibacillus jeotgali]